MSPDLNNIKRMQSRLGANIILPQTMSEDRIELKDDDPKLRITNIFGKCFTGKTEVTTKKNNPDLRKYARETFRREYDPDADLFKIVHPNDATKKIMYSTGTLVPSTFYSNSDDLEDFETGPNTMEKDALSTVYILNGNPSNINDKSKRQLGDLRFLQTVPQFENFLFQISVNFNSLYQPNINKNVVMPINSYFNQTHQGAAGAGCAFGSLLRRQFTWVHNNFNASAVSDNYERYPGVMINPMVSGFYSELHTFKNGFLNIQKVKFDAPAVEFMKDRDKSKMLKIIVGSSAFGVVVASNCSNVIYQDADDDKIYLLGKHSTNIHQAICATADLNQQKFRKILPWHLGSIFAAYHNTLQAACDMGTKCRGIVLVPMGIGVQTDDNRCDPIMAGSIFVSALKCVEYTRHAELRHIPILMALHDVNDPNANEFVRTIKVSVNCKNVMDMDDIENMTV
jgi:hypothetical protein